MKHTIKFETEISVEAVDCTTAEHAAMDFLDSFAPSEGMEFSYTMSPTSGICNHELELVEACPKCGTSVTRGKAFSEPGTGAESGKVFYYCSERCKEAH